MLQLTVGACRLQNFPDLTVSNQGRPLDLILRQPLLVSWIGVESFRKSW